MTVNDRKGKVKSKGVATEPMTIISAENFRTKIIRKQKKKVKVLDEKIGEEDIVGFLGNDQLSFEFFNTNH